MAETLIRKAEVDSLAQKLEGLSQDLTDEEKTLLLLMFGLAKQALDEREVEESEVSGFGMGGGGLMVSRPDSLPSVSKAFAGAFSMGGSTGMGGAAAHVHGEGGISGGTGGVTGTIKIIF